MAGRIHLQGKEIGVECRDGETILAALHRSGHAVRIGCRRGGCGICKVDLVEGDVAYTHVVAPSVLSEQDRADGVCLLCRTVPTGDVTVALRPAPDTGVGNAFAALYASLTGKPAAPASAQS